MPREAIVESILFETDVPEIVVARDAAGTAYLSLLIDRRAEGDVFLCVPASKQRLAALRTGGIDLREAFERGETGDRFEARYSLVNGTPTFSLQLVESIPEQWLPKAGFLLSEYIEETTHELKFLVDDAIASHSPVGMLELHPPESAVDSKIDSGHLVDGLRAFQTLVHHAYKKVMSKKNALDRAMLGGDDGGVFQILPNFEPGSFRIHFQSKQRADLVGRSGLGFALSKIDELTEFIDRPTEAIDVMKKNSGHVVGAYRELLRFIATEETPFAYSWSEPSALAPRTKRISVDDAKRFYEVLTTRTELSAVPVTLTGTFIDLRKAGVWGLRTDEKEVAGRIADGIGNPLAGVVFETQRYKILCEERLEEMVGKRPKITLYLTNVPEPVE